MLQNLVAAHYHKLAIFFMSMDTHELKRLHYHIFFDRPTVNKNDLTSPMMATSKALLFSTGRH